MNTKDNVISFLRRKTEDKSFTTYAQLMEIVENIPPDSNLTEAGMKYIGNPEHLAVLHNDGDMVRHVTDEEVGIINYIAYIAADIEVKTKNLSTKVPDAVYGAIEASINLMNQGNLAEARQGMYLFSGLVPEEIEDLIKEIRQLFVLYYAVKIKYTMMFSADVNFQKFCIIGNRLHKGLKAYSLSNMATL